MSFLFGLFSFTQAPSGTWFMVLRCKDSEMAAILDPRLLNNIGRVPFLFVFFGHKMLLSAKKDIPLQAE